MRLTMGTPATWSWGAYATYALDGPTIPKDWLIRYHWWARASVTTTYQYPVNIALNSSAESSALLPLILGTEWVRHTTPFERRLLYPTSPVQSLRLKLPDSAGVWVETTPPVIEVRPPL